MESRKIKSSFLLGISLAEISFILFFLLFLISAYSLKKKDIEINKNTETIEQLRQEAIIKEDELDESFKKISLIEDTFKNASFFTDNLTDKKKEEVIIRLMDVRIIIQEKEKAIKELDKALVHQREAEKSLQEMEEKNKILEDNIEQLSSLKPKINKPSFGNGIKDIISVINKIKSENKSLRGQLTHALNNLKPNGFGPPPCWADESGKIEYIYRIIISENNLKVVPVWPGYRESELESIPNSRLAAGKKFKITDFTDMMKPIYDWSKKQNPACRHFVRIVDKTNSKTSYKKNLLTIEQFFYKYLEH